MTAAQCEDQEGRALVQAIHNRKAALAQPLPTMPTYRGREWETESGKHVRSEFWRGYRHALDSIAGQIDEVQSTAIEASIT